MEDTMIRVSRERYIYLQEQNFKLLCLIANGVENWESYQDAMEDYMLLKENPHNRAEDSEA